MNNRKLLERAYILVLGVLVLLIIFTPLFIKEGISILDEELFEVVLSAVLFLVG